jgi:hypothetical protein
MPRARTFIALLCIGLVLVAAFTPGVAAHQVALTLDPVWALFLPPIRTFVLRDTARAAEHTLALVSPRFSRPPPGLA